VALLGRGRLTGAIAALCFAVAGAASAADDLRLGEQDIKAGLLYNFLRYTSWPPSRNEQAMVVCLYGRDPFSGQLTAMAGRTVNQRVIEVRQVRESAQTDACSLLFINSESKADWPRLRDYLSKRSVLTVSDYEGFVRSGGMIEFTRINNRVGMRVNVDAAGAANLVVQDRLLRLASVVRAGSP
jgi:hypothetical protein